ncbi:MAG: diadenylate cyclase CdaA [Clostridia bacterium]|nr:diadenylate cyclase CdaA [Clostridia bacterium]
MSNILRSIGDFFYYIWNQFLSIGISDILDIVIVSVLVYYVFNFVRQRRAGKLALGIFAVLLVMWISDFAGLNALNYILEMVFDVGIIAVIVIFQPELRSALETMGGNFRNLKNITEGQEKAQDKMIEELCLAVTDLSASRTGALIVLERTTRLGDEIRTGVEVDASVTKHLIENIFYNKAPLHDGAMIIREGRIHACGCFLPLTGNPNLPNELGTRHRAGLGVSEISDAFVIIVSEETGGISIARGGEIDKGVSPRALRHRLNNEFGLNREKKKSIIKRKGGKVIEQASDDAAKEKRGSGR